MFNARIFSFLALAMACSQGIVCAHPIPDVDALVTVSGGGEYTISLRMDVAAFIMQATPGHMGKELADEIRAMGDQELNSRIADAKKSLQKQMSIEFDGQRKEPAAIDFPSPEKVRLGAREHGTARRFVRIRGKVPSGAKSMTLAFPLELRRVLLEFEHDHAKPVHHTVTGGEESPPLKLPPTDVTSAIEGSTSAKVGLLAVALMAFATVGWLKRR